MDLSEIWLFNLMYQNTQNNICLVLFNNKFKMYVVIENSESLIDDNDINL